LHHTTPFTVVLPADYLTSNDTYLRVKPTNTRGPSEPIMSRPAAHLETLGSPTRRSASEVNDWLAVAHGDEGPSAVRVARPASEMLLPDLKRYIERCPDRFFVTLTTKRRYDSMTFSAEVAATLHRVNTALFGTSYKRKRLVALATYAIQERTLNDGLHVHILVGVPEDSLTLKPNRPHLSVPQLITETWVEMDPEYRSIKAQDGRPTNRLRGAFGYIEKDVGGPGNIETVDLPNCYFPTISAAVPA
jgi:hypothetical protein